MNTLRLRVLPTPARAAIASFALMLIGLHVAAQATVAGSVGGGSVPSAEEILWKYHGHPGRTALHEVLDLSLPQTSPRAMYWYLDATASPEDLTRVEARRGTLLAWAEAGAPESGWPPIRHLLFEEAMCLDCHAVGKEQADVPLETYEQVRRLAQPGRGVASGALLVSAHNHVFAFAVAALLLGLGVAFTAVRPALKSLLVLGAFGGAAIDVLGWFLTAAHGNPWQYAVLAGGALFGLATGAMIALVFDETALSGRIARALRLAPLDAPRPARDAS